jgi:hypothetical protein
MVYRIWFGSWKIAYWLRFHTRAFTVQSGSHSVQQPPPLQPPSLATDLRVSRVSSSSLILVVLRKKTDRGNCKPGAGCERGGAERSFNLCLRMTDRWHVRLREALEPDA